MPIDLRMVHLFTCIPFHYAESRLPYLSKVLSQQPSLAGHTDVRIFTDTAKPADLEQIESSFPKERDHCSFVIVPVPDLPHPYFLTWVHKNSLRSEFINHRERTHFMYVEDDMFVTAENMTYWLSARETLRKYGLIPSFFRVERKDDGVWRSTDIPRRLLLHKTPKVRVSPHEWFINVSNPYQGMYLFDRELALEHLQGPAMNPDFGKWNIREKAAQGQTFVAIPRGFIARNAVPFDADRLTIKSTCWVHHLPNTYANDKSTLNGKLAVDDLVRHPRLSRLLARATRPLRPLGGANPRGTE